MKWSISAPSPHAVTPARTALSRHCAWTHIQVATFVRMPLWAMRLLQLKLAHCFGCIATPDILGLRDRLEMFGANTTMDTAQMIVYQTLRRLPHQHMVSKAKSSQMSIASGVTTSSPQPTIAEVRAGRRNGTVLVDTRPKSLFSRAIDSEQFGFAGVSTPPPPLVVPVAPTSRNCPGFAAIYRACKIRLHRVTSGVMWADVSASRPHFYYTPRLVLS